ncbi:Spermidine synthase [Minicystis rosea]|nr:Spermidine synthase [Minicystis rosea]
MRGAHLAVGLVATIPPLALSRSGGPSVWLAALAMAASAELARLAARRWSPALARSYLVRRALSFRYLGPAFGLPLASAALVAHAGAIGAAAVVALHLGLAHAWRARLTRPGALRVVLPLAAVGGLFIALEVLAVSGYDWRLGGRLAYAEESRQQRLVLVEREGALDLFLDGELQLRTTDERLYHDGLVGPVLAASAHPRRVLVMGGGDGFAARDLLKHPSVERVLIVDWDPAVTRLFRCEPELSSLNEGALDDPRVEILHRDVREVLTAQGEPFDLVIGDLTDPDHAAEAAGLLSPGFFAMIRHRLLPDGLVVTHASSPAGAGAPCAVQTALEEAGFAARAYTRAVPCFGNVTYVVGSLPEHRVRRSDGTDTGDLRG